VSKTDPKHWGVSKDEWAKSTTGCFALRVSRVIEETHDSRSIVLEVPSELAGSFAYQAGQFLSFKIPFEGMVLTRSYSLSSSPDVDHAHKVTIKRVDDGRVSNWMNDHVEEGDTLMVTPPGGLFVLTEADRKIVLFGGGSGITPIISIVKTALIKTRRQIKLVYANRDKRSVIFQKELDALVSSHPDRLEVVHSLDDESGFLDLHRVKQIVHQDVHADFYLCGPGIFMSTVEEALRELRVDPSLLHVERFVSPLDPDRQEEAPEAGPEAAAEPAAVADAPSKIVVVLDGTRHEIAYEPGEKLLAAARRAGLDPPFSCEEGYCSCCMAKLVAGDVKMDVNQCLTPELLEEGWVLTCQGRCAAGPVEVEYPD